MAFKQGNNPLSRKASPMRMSPFKKEEPSMSMDELQKMSAAQDAASKSQANQLPQIEKPGADYEMDMDMSYPGGERGVDYDEEGTKDGMSRMEEAKYFGLGKDDGKARKTKKADKTAKQIVKMQNKRSSVKNVYLGDPDDLEGEMVRTADKPASKREVRKTKKLAKTKQQLSPLNSKFSDAVKDKSLLKEKPATAESASKAVSDFGDKIKKQAADTKGKKTAKDAGKVDKSSREGSNKQERQKRRAERKSIRKDKTLSSSQKKMAKKESRQKQKENVRGVKK